MIDTVHCYIELPYDSVDPAMFDHASVLMRRNVTTSVYTAVSPLCYLKLRRSDVDFLSLEFSIPTVLGCVYDNPDVSDISRVLAVLDTHLARFGDIPPIAGWTVTRIDYAVNLIVHDADEYVILLHGLECGTMKRDVYEHGVMWRNKSRAVKFYNKAVQLGAGDKPTVLRYEVSNHRPAVTYMCEHWFHCERSVAALTHPDCALYVLELYWQKLSLHNESVYKSVSVTQYKLKQVFASSALAAAAALQLIATHGRDAYKLELMSYQQYNSWSKKLTDAGFLPQPVESLSSLSFPKELFSSQNLELADMPPLISSQKNLGEN